MIVTWNTGRPYSKQGQIISARIIGEYIEFYDLTRMISGRAVRTVMLGCTEQELQRDIMSAYDNGNYDGTSFCGADTKELREAAWQYFGANY